MIRQIDWLIFYTYIHVCVCFIVSFCDDLFLKSSNIAREIILIRKQQFLKFSTKYIELFPLYCLRLTSVLSFVCSRHQLFFLYLGICFIPIFALVWINMLNKHANYTYLYITSFTVITCTSQKFRFIHMLYFNLKKRKINAF